MKTGSQLYKAIIISTGLLFSCVSFTQAHIEGTLFLEHPPKTLFGLRIQSSWFEINNDHFTLSNTPFVEYAPLNGFSIGAGLPTGLYNGSYLLSDMIVAAKANIPVKNFKIIPMVSGELPTGEAPATSGHPELVAAVFLEKKISNWHFYGYPGIRYSFEKDANNHHAAESPDVNVFKPHTDQELFVNTGFSYWVTEKFGIDTRVTTYYENFENIAPKIQAGGVFQTTTNAGNTFKASINGFYVPNGIREGYGGGLSVYYSL